MAGYLGDNAVTLPNLTKGPGETFFDVQALKDKQAQQAQANAERKKMDDYRSANMLQEEFKNQQYQTQQPDINDHISQSLNDGMQQILNAKTANPNMSYTDMLGQVRKVIQPIADLSNRVKTIQAANKSSIDSVKRDFPDVDETKLEQLANQNAFYTTDKDGKTVVKPVNEINDSKSYISDILQNQPDEVLRGISGLQKHVYSFHPEKLASSEGDMYKGVKQKYKWEVQLSPFSELQTDKDGTVTGAKIKSENVSIGNNKTIQVLPQDKMDLLMQDKGAAIAVNAAYQKFLKQNNLPIQKDSYEGQIIKRKIAKDVLENMNLQSFQSQSDVSKSAPATRIELGYAPYGKIPDPNSMSEYKNNTVQAIGRIFNNDPNYLKGKQELIEGRNMINVTAALPGGGLKHGRGEFDKYDSIYYDPVKKSLVTEIQPPNVDGKKQPVEQREIPESKVGDFISHIAEANGVPLAAVPKFLNEMGYKDGKFQSTVGAPQVQAKDEISGDQDQLGKFEKSGGVGKLDSYKGSVIGGKTVSDISSTYNPMNDYNYSIDLTDHEGKKETKTFKTKQQVANFLRGQQQPATQQQNNSETTDWKSRAKKL